MVVLRKANSHSTDICRLIKINNAKEDQGEELIQTLIYPKLPTAHAVLRRRNVTWCI